MRRTFPLLAVALAAVTICPQWAGGSTMLTTYLPLVSNPPPVFVTNHSWYRTNRLYVTGEVENGTNTEIYNVKVPIALIDDTGKQVGTSTASLLGYLGPGERDCFASSIIPEPDSMANYGLGTVSYSISASGNVSRDIFHLSDVQMEFNSFYGQYIITGKAEYYIYPCPPHCYTPSISATFYDADGQVFGCGRGGGSGDGHAFDFRIVLQREWQEGVTFRLHVQPTHLY